MSELGVLNCYRGRGVGTALVGQKLAHILLCGGRHYTLRTAAEGSRSRNIYESIGSVVIPGRQDVSSSEQVLVNKSQSRERVYLYGNCSTALARIFTRN
jgi:ribosomal protein S18 acetylase RimI-like enzyme